MKLIALSSGLLLLATVVSVGGVWGAQETSREFTRQVAFGPFTDASLCFSVFRDEKRTNFCLRSGEGRTISVRAGDTFCGVPGSDEPAWNCTRSPFNVP